MRKAKSFLTIVYFLSNNTKTNSAAKRQKELISKKDDTNVFYSTANIHKSLV